LKGKKGQNHPKNDLFFNKQILHALIKIF